MAIAATIENHLIEPPEGRAEREDQPVDRIAADLQLAATSLPVNL
jgi:hypothetical protein